MSNNRDFDGLSAIAQECWENSEQKGWHNDETFRALVLQAEETLKRWVNTHILSIPEVFVDLVRESKKRTQLANGVNIPEQLMLIVTEAAEAMEAFRDQNLDPQVCYQKVKITTVNHDGLLVENTTFVPYKDEEPYQKPEGVGSELSDIVIRTFVLAIRAKIPIVAEIRRKMKYNATRPSRHGGKRV